MGQNYGNTELRRAVAGIQNLLLSAILEGRFFVSTATLWLRDYGQRRGFASATPDKGLGTND
jgi:hypothetical protein